MSDELTGLLLIFLMILVIGIFIAVIWVLWFLAGYLLSWLGAPEDGRFIAQIALTLIFIGLCGGAGITVKCE